MGRIEELTTDARCAHASLFGTPTATKATQGDMQSPAGDSKSCRNNVAVDDNWLAGEALEAVWRVLRGRMMELQVCQHQREGGAVKHFGKAGILRQGFVCIHESIIYGVLLSKPRSSSHLYMVE